jgi:hypothetical protein
MAGLCIQRGRRGHDKRVYERRGTANVFGAVAKLHAWFILAHYDIFPATGRGPEQISDGSHPTRGISRRLTAFLRRVGKVAP